ncbi:hypothetical protein HBB16_17975 [Pseudonocardia sp. MCCB 268]|nr:hypothetical protein [Pseudonocardia cytotoxica]
MFTASGARRPSIADVSAVVGRRRARSRAPRSRSPAATGPGCSRSSRARPAGAEGDLSSPTRNRRRS